jgi:hypothetical protein
MPRHAVPNLCRNVGQQHRLDTLATSPSGDPHSPGPRSPGPQSPGAFSPGAGDTASRGPLFSGKSSSVAALSPVRSAFAMSDQKVPDEHHHTTITLPLAHAANA